MGKQPERSLEQPPQSLPRQQQIELYNCSLLPRNDFILLSGAWDTKMAVARGLLTLSESVTEDPEGMATLCKALITVEW